VRRYWGKVRERDADRLYEMIAAKFPLFREFLEDAVRKLPFESLHPYRSLANSPQFLRREVETRYQREGREILRRIGIGQEHARSQTNKGAR
jgi:hypothetical protein